MGRGCSCPKDLDVIIRMSDKGWITTDLFLAWGKSFVAQLPKDDPLPHILFLDGHGSHVYNLQFLNLILMQENNVRVWCFPPHTTQWLQPAVLSLFRSLKHNWVQEGLHFSRTNGAEPMGVASYHAVISLKFWVTNLQTNLSTRPGLSERCPGLAEIQNFLIAWGLCLLSLTCPKALS